MTLKQFSLLFISLLLFSGCEKTQSNLRSFFGMEEEINTIVQSDWEQEADDLFSRLTLEDEETPKLDLEMASLPPIQVAPALVVEKTTKKTAKKAKGKGPYVVQVGAFKSQGNAKNFSAKLNKRGFKAKVTEAQGVKGGTWYVVRLGTPAKLNSALTLAQKYSDQNSAKSMILKNRVNYKTISPRELVGSPATASNGYSNKGQNSSKAGPHKIYTVQVGGLYKKAHANKLLNYLKRKELTPYLVKVRDAAKINWWWSVRVGHFYDSESAQEKADILSHTIKVPLKVAKNAKAK